MDNIIRIEPKHEMYLNVTEDKSVKATPLIEPKHEMYLNKVEPLLNVGKWIIEPKHEMYLNNRRKIYK